MERSRIKGYSEEDRAHIREYLRALTKPKIQALLEEAGFAKTALKDKLLERVRAALDDGSLAYEHVVAFLDREVPWQSQHVFLFDSRGGDTAKWKNRTQFARTLARNKIEHLLGQELPLIVVNELAVCQILHNQERLVVVAMDSREKTKNLSDLTYREPKDDRTIEWRAYEVLTERGLIRFEWDFPSDTAMLQITQLEADGDYEKASKAFKELVSDWLPIDTLFANINLSKAIASLREREQNGDHEARSSAIDLAVDGRHVTGKSSSGKTPFVGAKSVNDAFAGMLSAGAAHFGNFAWQPDTESTPLSTEISTRILAQSNRVNFSAQTSEAIIRHVIGRIRVLAQ
jgi:hypothetical protein